MEILRAKGYLPYSMGKIVPVRLSSHEIRAYIIESKKNSKFFSEGIRSEPDQPEKDIRIMNVSLQKYFKAHQLQLRLIFDKTKNNITATAVMRDREMFGNRPRYFLRMEKVELFRLESKTPAYSDAGMVLFTAPMEDVFYLACTYQPEFVDIFNSFLALPSTEEN